MGRNDWKKADDAGEEKAGWKTETDATHQCKALGNRNTSVQASRGPPPAPSNKLHVAIRSLDWHQALARCSDHPEDMLYVASNGYSMLHVALEKYGFDPKAKRISDDIFFPLVEKLSQANRHALTCVCKCKGYTPLHVACSSCHHPPSVKLLLNRCPPDAGTLQRILDNCHFHHIPLELSHRILEYVPNPALMQDKHGKTPLFLACQFSKKRLNITCTESLVKIVSMLVRRFPEAKDIVDNTGRTPLEVVKQQKKFLDLAVILGGEKTEGE
jgi:hypothetical protein